MSEDLLQKTRALNGLMQASAGQALSFAALARVLAENAVCNTFIADQAGEVLGHFFTGDSPCAAVAKALRAGLSPAGRDYLAGVEDTRTNLSPQGEGCIFDPGGPCPGNNIMVTVVPVVGDGRRWGTLVLTAFGRSFTAADVVLAEYAATMAGVEAVRRHRGHLQDVRRRRAVVQAAVAALSPAEVDAVRRMMPALQAGPGLLVTTRVASNTGCARSVVVNALHKLKSAGLVEAKSHGVKGTYVRLLDELLLDQIVHTECRRVRGTVDKRAAGEFNVSPGAGRNY